MRLLYTTICLLYTSSPSNTITYAIVVVFSQLQNYTSHLYIFLLPASPLPRRNPLHCFQYSPRLRRLFSDWGFRFTGQVSILECPGSSPVEEFCDEAIAPGSGNSCEAETATSSVPQYKKNKNNSGEYYAGVFF
ncbi:hypothetical protein AKJ16_DCAP05994 [Drosera capensis]